MDKQSLKHKVTRKTMLFSTLVLVMLLVIGKEYVNNINLKKEQGELYKKNFNILANDLNYTEYYLTKNIVNKKEDIILQQQEFKNLSELCINLPSGSHVSMYVEMINIDFNNLLKAVNSSESEEEIKRIKDSALSEIVVLEKTLEEISEECNDNSLKYYKLKDAKDPIIIKTNKELIDYLNKNNIH